MKNDQTADVRFVLKFFVVLFVGFAIVATPNLIEALRRNQQKKTLFHLRDVGAALENARRDGYPCISRSQKLPAYVTAKLDAEQLLDGWRRPLIVLSSANRYAVMSLGSDGRADARYDGAEFNDFTGDTVYSNGDFLHHPGIATQPSMLPRVADALAEASDCSKRVLRRGCDFYLYLPSQRAARDAAADVARLGFTYEVPRSASNGKWLCVATKKVEHCYEQVPHLKKIENAHN